MNQPMYSYAHRGNLWAVLKWQYLPNGATATPLCYFVDKQDAIRMVAELNSKAMSQ